jgi:hypothetical protein
MRPGSVKGCVKRGKTAKAHKAAQRLQTIPGIGPITASARVPLIGTRATADLHQGAQPPC